MSKNSKLYVVNPATSRPIKIGSRAYIKLVKLGVFDPEQVVANEEDETTDSLISPKEEMPLMEEKSTKKTKLGKYAKKIEERKTTSREPKSKATSRESTSKIDLKIKPKLIPGFSPVKEESSSSDEESDYEQLEREIEKMIINELQIHRLTSKKVKADTSREPKKEKKVVEKTKLPRGRPKKVIEVLEESEANGEETEEESRLSDENTESD